jgi:hypothetical protein
MELGTPRLYRHAPESPLTDMDERASVERATSSRLLPVLVLAFVLVPAANAGQTLAGADGCVAVNVVGKTVRAARQALYRSGCRPAQVKFHKGACAPESRQVGLVRKQTVSRGHRLPAGRVLHVYVWRLCSSTRTGSPPPASAGPFDGEYQVTVSLTITDVEAMQIPFLGTYRLQVTKGELTGPDLNSRVDPATGVATGTTSFGLFGVSCPFTLTFTAVSGGGVDVAGTLTGCTWPGGATGKGTVKGRRTSR